ncbi:hybrid sensor histidine kinase/response regulator transcription factor [Geofilum sp. OHC36d9]|uniref:hybrid sensor histidine kinase/response regulator transcription factor n=1 Tax=Geofilum sp. OHC36d9 TaxID=3458413 RepID=UPI004034A194
MGKKILFITICCFVLSQIKAENTFSIQTYTTKDGLSQNTINTIVQDKEGFLWFGSLNGLNRYDGNEFIWLHPQYGIKNTLSDSRIKKIHKDSFGYLWIRTNIDNINCYDPETQKFIAIHPWSTQHKHILFASSGDVWLWGNKTGCLRAMHTSEGIATHFYGFRELNDYSVNLVFEDASGTIWIGTNSNLFILQKQKLTKIITDVNFHSLIELDSTIYAFTNNNKIYKINKFSKDIISKIPHNFNAQNGSIHNTARLSDNNILITTNNDTYILDTRNSSFKSARNLFDQKDLKNAFIQYDNKRHIWIYNKTGIIWQYKEKLNQFIPYSLIPSSTVRNIDMERYSIFHDSRNIIWITTYGNGLFAIDQNNNNIHHFTNNKNQPNGALRTNNLLTVTEDRCGNIWVGTEYSGVSKITITDNQYRSFYPGTTESKNRIIRLIYEDSDKNIWIGTKNGTLYIYDENYSLIAKHQLKVGMPYTLAEDSYGNKWIGTKGNGLLIFKKNEYHSFYSFNENFRKLNPLACNIYATYLDNQQRMWLGTFGYGLLLARFNNDKLTLQEFPTLKKYQNRIRTIEQDRDSLIWLGGNNGITVFNPDLLLTNKANIKNFHFDANNDSSLNNNEVKTIFNDSKGNLWVGTSGGGLNRIIKDQKLKNIRFKHYTTSNGLINDIVQGIVEDDNKLWISTESGISVMNIENECFDNYHLSTQWEGDLFCESAIVKSLSGKILLGSYDGLYTINPDDLKHPSKKENVILTALKINGVKMHPGQKDSPLKESISDTKKINLKYTQNSFNIKFSILNYQPSNRYKFILDGYEDNWNSLTQHNEATYRNIPPGIYTFRVKANNVGRDLEQSETKLEILISQPIWNSTQAIILYFILFSGIIIIVIRTNKRMYKLNTAVKLEQQVTEYKLQFFTNISHEFRTPLTIIKGTIDNISTTPNIDKHIKKQLSYLEKSSNRLLRLINQLLDYQKIQYGHIKLDTEKTEVIAFFKDIYQHFEDTAKIKNVSYLFTSNINAFEMPLDRNKIEKVIYNLLSNAFKFVPQNGSIKLDININQQSEHLIFSVSDNGEGVPPKEQHSLFTRFKQIKPSDSGTGIGLNYSYELIKIHQGNIKYKETPNGGATFVVTIPILKDKFILNPKNTDTTDVNTFNEHPAQNTDTNIHYNSRIDINEKYKNYKILIIEDDNDVSDFLSDYLSQYFDIKTAADGLEGLNKCKLINPKLIICDAMMPKMNGYEVIKKIKSEFQTCHIPVIMLTAYTTQQHQIQGIESGADAYLTKPFNSQYLLTRIIKLLEQREILQRKFTKEPGLAIDPQLSVNIDNEFIKKLNIIIEKNIDNAEFSIDNFYKNMSMGRTLFYKKVKSITGFTPNEYLRVLRMKKAAELLETTQLNVSEVAFKVGNNNPFYFSTCFKSQFGVSPSEYAKKRKAKR